MCHQLDNWEVSCSCKIVTSLLDNILQFAQLLSWSKTFSKTGGFSCHCFQSGHYSSSMMLSHCVLEKFFLTTELHVYIIKPFDLTFVTKIQTLWTPVQSSWYWKKKWNPPILWKVWTNTSEQKYCKVFFLYSL